MPQAIREIAAHDLDHASSTAAAIQQVIDGLPPEGGRVILPSGEWLLDRGIALRSGVELAGQGVDTLLKKAPGRVYPFTGYHNYGMCDVPLMFTDGLEVGMTVAVRDRAHGGFFETLARITWVEDNWVGLDRGVHSDYAAEQGPELVTAFPLVYAEDAHDVAVRHLTLDGNREEQPDGIGSCRGAAIYFIHCARFAVSDVVERGFYGEGLGFQLCRDGRIQRCRFDDNLGNGYHPGAGSTGVLFADCVAQRNSRSGFFFCVRANHITVRGCTFRENAAYGVSVGTRDCHNVIVDCLIEDNACPGVYFRPADRPVEVHSCLVRGCRVAGNAAQQETNLSTLGAQIEIAGDAHDLLLIENTIQGNANAAAGPSPGIAVDPRAERVWMANNAILDCWPPIVAEQGRLASEAPAIEAGHEMVREEHYRHLTPQAPQEGAEA
jgi:hypothetical protein